jgi:hypothetical protein
MAFRIRVRQGEDHPLARISNAERFEVHGRFSRREATVATLAKEKGMAPSSMRSIVTNPRWKNKG